MRQNNWMGDDFELNQHELQRDDALRYILETSFPSPEDKVSLDTVNVFLSEFLDNELYFTSHRTIMKLYILDGLNPTEIACELNITRIRVASVISCAFSKLRQSGSTERLLVGLGLKAPAVKRKNKIMPHNIN